MRARSFFSSGTSPVQLSRRCKPVERPVAVLSRGDQTGALEICEMPRRGRLRDAADRNEIAHADLPVLQQMKDAEPQRVRERSKDPIYWDRNHIRSSGFKYSDGSLSPLRNLSGGVEAARPVLMVMHVRVLNHPNDQSDNHHQHHDPEQQYAGRRVVA
jgi:hypothetical protein